MLCNDSYNNPGQTNTINDLVGEAYSIKERFKMGGIGSPKLEIVSSSTTIHSLLVLDHNTNYSSIELRPKGIILRFRALLETYALVIPFYKLTIFKGDTGIYSVYMDNYFVKVKADTKAIQKYFKRILDAKIANDPNQSYH